MNIFASDISPVKSAQWLDDKRVKHMPKESFEMISMAILKNTGQCVAPLIIWNIEHRANDALKFDELFNNRCTNWVASKRENIWWLTCHTIALLNECRYRFGTSNYVEPLLYSIIHHIPEAKELPTTFPNSSGYNGDDIFENYKKCLNYKWLISDEVKPCLWTKRGSPSWLGIASGEYTVENTNKQLEMFNEELEDLPF